MLTYHHCYASLMVVGEGGERRGGRKWWAGLKPNPATMLQNYYSNGLEDTLRRLFCYFWDQIKGDRVNE